MRGRKRLWLCCLLLWPGACLAPQAHQSVSPIGSGDGDDSTTATAQSGVGNASDLVDLIASLHVDSDPAVMIALLVAVIAILLGVVLLLAFVNLVQALLTWRICVYSHKREVLRIQRDTARSQS